MNKRPSFLGKKITSVIEDGRKVCIMVEKEPASVPLLKFNYNGQACADCFFLKECAGEFCTYNKLFKSERYWHYANKAQTEALITEWDQRYIDEGGLFICSDAEACIVADVCLCSKPNSMFEEMVKCTHGNDCYPIPYRGERPEPTDYFHKKMLDAFKNAEQSERSEPTNEDLSDVRQDVLKEESEMDNVEYVVLKDFNLDDIAESDISSSVFLKMYKLVDPSCFYETGSFIPSDWKNTPIVHELALLGFIEEKVNDPEVDLGDKFKNHEGVWMAVNSFSQHMHLVLIEKTNVDAESACEGCSEGNSSEWPCKLSDLIGKDMLKDFRRVD